MDQPFRVGDVTVMPTHLTIPGVGVLTVNSYVLHGAEPVLVDSGLVNESSLFVDALRTVIDPAEIKCVWLSHDDMDHTGALEAVLGLAPEAKLVTHALGALRMSTWWPLPLERVHAVVPGDRIEVGDRTLVALRPATYDNPTTTGFFDESTRTLFAVDSFGAILPEYVTDVDDVPEEALVGGMIAWAAFDSPWTQLADRSRFSNALDDVRRLEPSLVLTSHLPPTTGRLDQLVKVVESVPDADPFVPPDAAAFGQIVAALQAGA